MSEEIEKGEKCSLSYFITCDLRNSNKETLQELYSSETFVNGPSTRLGGKVQMEDDCSSSARSQNMEFISIKDEPLEEDSNDGEFYNNLVHGTVKTEYISEIEDEQSSHSIEKEERIHTLEFISIKGEPTDSDSNDLESYDSLMQGVKDTNISDNDENCIEDYNINSGNVGATKKRHLKCHKAEKDFSSISFTVKGSLIYNMKISNGQKDVHCSVGNRPFMAKNITKNHGEIQNKLVDDTKHICYICKKECKTSAGLKKHSKTHKDNQISEGRYPCSQCNKTFVHLSSIKAHLVTHMPQKPDEDNLNTQSDSPETRLQILEGIKLQEKNSRVGVRDCYLCFACNKTFKTVKSLNIHKKCHIPIPEKKKQVKRFPCSTCNKEYKQKSSLDAHLISHMRAYEYY